MKGSVWLIGGGEIRRGETAEIDEALKELAPKDSPLVFFGSASRYQSEYINAIQSVLGNHFHIIAPTEKDGPEFARLAIRDASVIYLGGGDTDLLLNDFEQWQLVEPLREALSQGVHLVGMSAGAQAVSAWYVYENEGLMDLRSGWGFLPACVYVHAQQESLARVKTLWEEHMDAKKNTLLAIGESAAWCVSQASSQKIGPGNFWQV